MKQETTTPNTTAGQQTVDSKTSTKRFIKPKVYMSNLFGDLQQEIKHPIYNMVVRIADNSFKEIAKIAIEENNEKILSILKPLCYVS